jgi:Fe2+ transport system protein FeoA
MPGKDLTVVERLPFDGPVLLRIGEQTERVALSPSLAKQVFVIPKKPGAAG